MSSNQETVQISVPVFYIKDFKGNRIPTCETPTERCKFLNFYDSYGDTIPVCSYTDGYFCYSYIDTESKIYNDEELQQLERVSVDEDYYYNRTVKILSDPNHLNDGIHHREGEIAVIKFLEPCKECPLHNSKLSTFW